jgi:site-specific DNA-methyltransferase (adenine-specific)
VCLNQQELFIYVVSQKYWQTSGCQHHVSLQVAAGLYGTTKIKLILETIGDVLTKVFSILEKAKKYIFNTDNVCIPYGSHTLQYPEHPQAETSQYGKGSNKNHLWQPHPGGAKPRDVLEIPTTCNGMHEKTPHPTQKPEELLRKIVLASSNPGDTVIDPFLGSGTTAVVAEQLKRNWKGCDVSVEYAEWAAKRIELVEDWPLEKWLQYDIDNVRRRKSIR